jgi:predicted nucleic acid-binding protein
MIFLDSWIWLELYSKTEKWEKCKEIVLSSTEKCISTMVIIEVKYKGTKKFGLEMTEKIISNFENNENIKIIPVTNEIAKLAADLRLKYYSKTKNISYGDCINLATALLTNCKKLYSGDPDFKDIDEIKTIVV